MSEWIDVSVAIRPGMHVWPGDGGVSITQVQDMGRGDGCNLTALAMGSHTGTHMDAPHHFVHGAASMDALPMDAVMGECRVIPIADPEAVHAAELAKYDLQRGERILLKTRNSEKSWLGAEFDKDFVYIAEDGARHLAERGVRTVGVDYLSIGGFYKDGKETHEVLLGAGVWAIEGLDLSRVEPGRYELVCLPLKVAGAEGAPARAVVRKLR